MDIDNKVALSVMGWDRRGDHYWWWLKKKCLVDDWIPSTDWDCAEMVLDRVEEKYAEKKFIRAIGGDKDPGWACLRATPADVCEAALEAFKI
jgi:hypothetical protein